MSVCSAVATLLALSTTVLGNSKFMQYAFRFESSQNCQVCTGEDIACFSGILSCVYLSFYTHNVSVVTQFCNADQVWMLLVLELQPVGKVDNSQYLDGCAANMLHWKYWYYAECTIEISGADDYRNCSVSFQPSIANPVPHLPTWVSVVIALLASFLTLVIIILLIIICACWHRKRACIHPQGEGNREVRPLLDDDRAPPHGASSESSIQDRDDIGDSATEFRLFNRLWLKQRPWLPQNWFRPTAQSSAVKDES